MAIFTCRSCGYSQSTSDEYIGRNAKCPKCNQPSVITDNLSEVSPELEFDDMGDNPEESSMISKCDGGSIQTQLGFGFILNKNSSLSREWIIYNDPEFPTQLIGKTGVTTDYENDSEYGTGDYFYSANYTIQSSVMVQAVEVRFLTFNVWGVHDKTLSAVQIEDMPAEKNYNFKVKWNIFSENEASEYYASIAFVAQIRTAEGRVLRSDTDPVLAQAKQFSAKFSEADLEPKNPNQR